MSALTPHARRFRNSAGTDGGPFRFLAGHANGARTVRKFVELTFRWRQTRMKCGLRGSRRRSITLSRRRAIPVTRRSLIFKQGDLEPPLAQSFTRIDTIIRPVPAVGLDYACRNADLLIWCPRCPYRCQTKRRGGYVPTSTAPFEPFLMFRSRERLVIVACQRPSAPPPHRLARTCPCSALPGNTNSNFPAHGQNLRWLDAEVMRCPLTCCGDTSGRWRLTRPAHRDREQLWKRCINAASQRRSHQRERRLIRRLCVNHRGLLLPWASPFSSCPKVAPFTPRS